MKFDKIPIPGAIHNLALVIVEINTLALASTDDEQRDKLNSILEMVADALALIATLED
jgi:hypothetical protein